LLNHVIRTCRQRDKPVTLCGEMAGRPRLALPLFGMGLTRMSMSPAFVPSIKSLFRSVTQMIAQEVSERVLQMTTIGEMRAYLTRRVQQICPNAAMMDVGS
jgi:phosphoenolpyruvate-protein phosphotransferase (PTS system enzyme I)